MYTYISEKDAVLTFTPQSLLHITGGTEKKLQNISVSILILSPPNNMLDGWEAHTLNTYQTKAATQFCKTCNKYATSFKKWQHK
jgi:hypothetical protein